MKYKKGFTLLELLVIIAIIGILSSVILVFLSSARNKAKDSAIKQELNHLKTQANIYLPTGTGSDVTSCGDSIFVNNAIKPLLDSISGTKWCKHSGGQDFIVTAALVSDPDQSWCVDSSNNSHQIATPASLPTGYICPSP